MQGQPTHRARSVGPSGDTKRPCRSSVGWLMFPNVGGKVCSMLHTPVLMPGCAHFTVPCFILLARELSQSRKNACDGHREEAEERGSQAYSLSLSAPRDRNVYRRAFSSGQLVLLATM